MTVAAALLVWTLPAGGEEPAGFRVYRCEPGDPGAFRVHAERVEERSLEVDPGLYRVSALYDGQPVADGAGQVSPGTVESPFSDPIEVIAETLPPDPAPLRVRVTIFSAPDLTREDARVEVITYHEPTGPARFWWAEIETTSEP